MSTTTAPAKTALPNEGRPGYKHTKLGWIPEEWKVKLLDDVARRGSGHTPNRKTPEYHNGGIKWISLVDSPKLDNGLITETEFEVSELGIANSSAVLHPAGTVLMSRDADVGKIAVMGRSMAVSQHFMTWTCDERLDNWYLYYTLQLRKQEFKRIAVGSTIKTIGLPYFKKLAIIYPPPFEQRRIAVVLGAWDRAIATVHQLLAAQQKRERGLMQELLTGKRRFPGFRGKWVKRSIGEMIEESRIPVAQPDPVRRITVRLHLAGVGQRIIRGTEATDATGYFHRKAGQFIYGKQNLHKGAMGIVPNELNGYESTQDIPAFDFLPGTHPTFFLYLMSRTDWYPQLEKYATGTGSKRLHPEELYQVSIRVPDTLEEQSAIAKAIGALGAEIRSTQQQLDLLTTQKRGLMQQLLTGQTRVKA
jgi:type I restriction enzyme S subunit